MTGERLVAIAREAIESLEPSALVCSALEDDGRAVTLLALGKAAPAMARGARAALGESIAREVVVGLDRGGHPLPDAGSLEAGRALLSAARAAGSDERVVALISGGGSSLAVALAGGLSLEDAREANRALIEGGASIDEINIVRKHISSLKGGRLALAAAPAELTTLVLSDVVSGDLSAVASGPTLADASTFASALAIAGRLLLPESIVSHLARGARGEIAETPAHVAGTVELLADNRAMVEGAAAIARRAGHAVRVIEQPLVGDPAGALPALTAWLAQPGQLVVAGGEMTPTVPPGARGTGGRAHHLALLATPVLERHRGAVLLALGSDGVDGPSGGSGAVVSSDTQDALEAAGVDSSRALLELDSAGALAAVGAQIPARPTGSNLADLVLVWTGDGDLS